MNKLIEIEQVKKLIKDFQNPYPEDIFKWDNKEKVDLTRGRFNEFTYNVIENTRQSLLRDLEEMEEGE